MWEGRNGRVVPSPVPSSNQLWCGNERRTREGEDEVSGGMSKEGVVWRYLGYGTRDDSKIKIPWV